jgi:glycerol-3-phosphate dehydrogenase
MSPDKIFPMLDKKTTAIRIENNPKEAIKQIKNKLNKKDVMVILGSHYFGPYIHTIFKNCFDIGIKNLNFQQ